MGTQFRGGGQYRHLEHRHRRARVFDDFNFTFVNSVTSNPNAQQYTLFHSVNPINGTLGANVNGVINASVPVDIAISGGDVVLQVVPEPNALSMLAGSLGLALGLQRFRRRRSACKEPRDSFLGWTGPDSPGSRPAFVHGSSTTAVQWKVQSSPAERGLEVSEERTRPECLAKASRLRGLFPVSLENQGKL